MNQKNINSIPISSNTNNINNRPKYETTKFPKKSIYINTDNSNSYTIPRKYSNTNINKNNINNNIYSNRTKNPPQNDETNNNIKGKRRYQTYTYNSSLQDPLNSGSIVITSSKMNEDNKDLSSRGRMHHMISIHTPRLRSNSKNRGNYKSITIISSSEYIAPDKEKNNGEIVEYDNNNDKRGFYLRNKNNNNSKVHRTYITNFNIRNNNYNNNSKTETNYNTDNKIALSDRDKNNNINKDYRYIPSDRRKNINKNYNQNNLNINKNNNSSNFNSQSNNANNVHINSYTTKRIKDYKKDDKNINYNKDKNNIQNKANNIGFKNLNMTKNKLELNKEIKNEPIVHNTLIILTRRKPSNKNVSNNIQILDIKKDNKYLEDKNDIKNKKQKIAIKTNYNYNFNEKNKINIDYKTKEKRQENNIQKRKEIQKENVKENKNEIKMINKIDENDFNIKYNINKRQRKFDEKKMNNKLENENNIVTNINKEDKKDNHDNQEINIETNKNNISENDIYKIKEKIEEIKVEVEEINTINKEPKEEILIEDKNFDILKDDKALKITSPNITDNLNINIPTTNLDINPDINTYDKYNLLTSLELSDETKAFLTSYNYTSSLRPELNDYTKAYLDTLNDNTTDIKPELTNLTKEYLSQNTGFDDKKIEDYNIDDSIKIEEN